jgi:hypothetical protein
MVFYLIMGLALALERFARQQVHAETPQNSPHSVASL